MEQFRQLLKDYWGYDDFRPLQGDIIESVASGHDTLGLMPTGGGKSLTFQVPAMAMEGICIVVTPLIALMKDQVANLVSKGIKALAIHSGLSSQEISIAFDNAIFGNYKFLYISPERLSTDLFRDKLQQMKVALLAVDEAHCISQWGYDFRPSYLRLSELRDLLPGVPVLALTATATLDVVDDIQQKLKFQSPNVFRKSFERSNLVYVVRYAEDKEERLVQILESTHGSAIVYVRSRKKTRELAIMLNEKGIRTEYFHAGLDHALRDERQKRWTIGQTRVMVATNAFGMGIDKPDVRLVVHIDAPDSPEAYFQEAGRAGRDEKKAYALLLWSNADGNRLQKNIASAFPEQEVVKRVYEALGNFFQLAVGSGYNMVYDFNIARFCGAYHFNMMVVYNSLKILQRAGYIEYTEEMEMPSRVHFLMERDELYKFQVANEAFDAFIKLLLRSYTGLFTEYVVIHEELLASRTGISRDVVYKYLNKLDHLRVIHYIPQKKTPLVVFTRSREDVQYVSLSREVYADRKQRYETRVNAITSYATTTHVCRSRMLLRYFGETDAQNCGKCDVCIERRKTAVDDELFEKTEQELKSVLASGAVHVDILSRKLGVTPAGLQPILRWLEDSGAIDINPDGLCEWVGD
jgi:ATP-dependent DNA helicase RecQ